MVSVLVLAFCWTAGGAAIPALSVLDASFHSRQSSASDPDIAAARSSFFDGVDDAIWDSVVAPDDLRDVNPIKIATTTHAENVTLWTTTPSLRKAGPYHSTSARNTYLLVACIVAVAVCFILGIILAIICVRNFRSAEREGASYAYAFKLTSSSTGPESSPEYESEEQTQIFNYQTRVAQMRRNLNSRRGMTPMGSAPEDTSDREEFETVNAPRNSSPELILGTYGPATVSSARIVNPIFDSKLHGAIGAHASPAKKSTKAGNGGGGGSGKASPGRRSLGSPPQRDPKAGDSEKHSSSSTQPQSSTSTPKKTSSSSARASSGASVSSDKDAKVHDSEQHGSKGTGRQHSP